MNPITARLLNQNEEFLEELKIKKHLVEFILYRGRLFQRIAGTDNFKQRQYLEIN